jgi:hypothetical protein
MRTTLLALAVLALAAVPAAAADAWGLPDEKEQQVKGRVVDVLCLAGRDCPPDCGAGKRQLGLLTEDGRLVLAAKGGVNFAGAVLDLLPHCGKTVEADGLMIENPRMRIYFVQYLRTDPAQPWAPADAFVRAWSARHGVTEEWMRADPAVQAQIARNGKLGIPGLAVP